jgi:hypothetical protein
MMVMTIQILKRGENMKGGEGGGREKNSFKICVKKKLREKK